MNPRQNKRTNFLGKIIIMRKLILAIDFDGVIVSCRYPEIGVLRNGAREAINTWYKTHTIIINTCRCGVFLEEMRAFLNREGINYHLINENSAERIGIYNTDSRKISFDLCFDDKNAGGFPGWEWARDQVGLAENFRPIIVCIIGESGSGKSTLARRLEAEYGHTLISSFTDRPSRGRGDDHTFLTPEEFDAIDPEDFIAFTTFGGFRYCCTRQNVRDHNLYVIDQDGYCMLREKYSDVYDIRTIRMKCGRDERVRRVGEERVNRDTGRFTMSAFAFDHIINTDAEYDVSSLLDLMY